MTRKELVNSLIYLAFAVLVSWLSTREGPPLRLSILYHTAQAAQWTSWQIGKLGLNSELAYHHELERQRTQ